MRYMYGTIAACVVGICVTSAAAWSSEPSVGPLLDPRLQPISFALGVFRCEADYRTVPPFTEAHHVTALAAFLPDVKGASGAEWIVGSYIEITSTGGATPLSAPISIKDSISLDPLTGEGVRVLFDSKGGRMIGGFTIEGGHILHFDRGDYQLGPFAVPFLETVVYNEAAHSFTAESQVVLGGVPVTFQTLTCVGVR